MAKVTDDQRTTWVGVAGRKTMSPVATEHDTITGP